MTERGFWSASNPETTPELPPHSTYGQVTFPMTLSVASLSEANTHFIPKAKTTELETVAGSEVAGCVASTETPKAGLLLHPQANAGNLCVYTGTEELTNMKEQGIVTTANAPGTRRTGAAIVFQQIEGGVPAKVKALGSWAVRH